MSDNFLKIGIVGGGIGGLALSISLKKIGFEVTVFERSDNISTYGAGVQLSPNGFKVLRDLGVEKEIDCSSYSPKRIVIRNGINNKYISEIKLGSIATNRYNANFVQIHRSDLIEILYQKAVNLGVEFNFGSSAQIKSTSKNSPIVCVKQGNYEFDVAVGADGVHSTTREGFFKRGAPQFLRQVAYRATIPLEKVADELCEPEVKILVGPGRHIVLYPLISRSLLNIVLCQDERVWSSDGWSVPADVTELSQAFGSFKGIETILNGISSLNKWGLFGYKNPSHWNSGRVVLLGDACHPMLPYLAQGANQALEDAISLAYFLSPKFGVSVSSGLEGYSKNRRSRILKVQRAASRNAKLYHLSEGPGRFISHSGLKLVSHFMPNFLLSQFDWLYGYNFPR